MFGLGRDTTRHARRTAHLHQAPNLTRHAVISSVRWSAHLLALLAIAVPAAAGAQVLTVGDPTEDYLRALHISGQANVGSFTVRPFRSANVWAGLADGAHPWADRLGPPTEGEASKLRISLSDAELRTFVNSGFPFGSNDGAVWQGKGVTSVLDGGATAAWGGFSLSIRPRLIYSHNAGFELAPVTVAGVSEYTYPWRTIDLPQRYGPDAAWTLDAGQSEVRFDGRGVSVGFATTNLWWGPSIRNAIVMSNNAPGIPHVFLGTDGPVGIGIGDVEARWIWGDLDQSDWFDPAVADRDRFITGIVAAYSPSFLPGLSLGFTRVFQAFDPDDGVPFGDYFAVFQGLRKRGFATPENPRANDVHDQLASLFGRWELTESGFEVFGEWARNDHSWDLRDFLLEPEHSQAYSFGLQKATPLSGNRILTLAAELTHLQGERTDLIRGGNPTYYVHHIVTPGYTHKGQVIGAGVGPGGKAQYLGVDLYAPWGRAGASFERGVIDNDAYYALAEANDLGVCCHDVTLNFGAHTMVFVDDFDLGLGMLFTREFNRYFIDRRDVVNVNLTFSARWRPR